MTGRPLNQDKQNALDLGLLTYEGKPHFRCGTTTRYVVGAGCVHCARVIATEQRQARKFLRQHAINEAEQKAREDDGVALDSIVPDGLEEPDVPDVEAEDDADARFQESIEELM